mmetsp:Transcript_65298/g.147338  ORF Transcript_65298/g.147338 Transcript_65298/m.147338 type:complete len:208 (+) Transcript_65298:973-1596(+)
MRSATNPRQSEPGMRLRRDPCRAPRARRHRPCSLGVSRRASTSSCWRSSACASAGRAGLSARSSTRFSSSTSREGWWPLGARTATARHSTDYCSQNLWSSAAKPRATLLGATCPARAWWTEPTVTLSRSSRGQMARHLPIPCAPCHSLSSSGLRASVRRSELPRIFRCGVPASTPRGSSRCVLSGLGVSSGGLSELRAAGARPLLTA